MFTQTGLVVLSLIGISLLCLILWVFGPSIYDEFIVLQRKQDLSDVESEFNAIFDDLPQSESDTVLATHTNRLTIGRGLFIGCIKGSKEIIYGTTREFADVIDEYEVLFEDRQPWTQSSETSYYTKKAWFRLYLEEPSSFTYPPNVLAFQSAMLQIQTTPIRLMIVVLDSISRNRINSGSNCHM
jgi:hypothetical protein